MGKIAGQLQGKKRWKADIVYRTESGPLDITHYVNEIAEVHDLIECGPHWDCLVSCTITRFQHITSETLTVEEAEQL